MYELLLIKFVKNIKLKLVLVGFKGCKPGLQTRVADQGCKPGLQTRVANQGCKPGLQTRVAKQSRSKPSQNLEKF